MNAVSTVLIVDFKLVLMLISGVPKYFGDRPYVIDELWF